MDDDRSVRESLDMILQYEDYEVIQAANGKEALLLLKSESENIDLAIVDIKMPGIDGIEVLQKIKANYPNIEVVMVSGMPKSKLL